MPTYSGPEGRQMAHFDVKNPDDLKALVRSGAIWRSPYIQQGIDAIESGLVPLADCKNIPPQIEAILRA